MRVAVNTCFRGTGGPRTFGVSHPFGVREVGGSGRERDIGERERKKRDIGGREGERGRERERERERGREGGRER